MEQAGRNLGRQKTLQQKGFAATATLDQATRDLDVATADIAVSKAQIESAKAAVAQREAALKQAEIDLDRTKILAPIKGTVISRTVDVGQTVAASLQAPELFKIAQDLQRISVEAQVNEADVGQVAEGNPVSFTVDAYPDRTFKGKVTQVRLAATELQNVVTYTVIIEASNDDRRLYPGMTANVQIAVAEKADVLRVPNDALRFKVKGESEQGGGSPTSRLDRTISRLKNDLALTAEQESRLREELAKVMAARAGGSSGGNTGGSTDVDPAAARQRMQATIEQTLQPMLNEEQKPLFDKWKRGRETTKAGSVYVMDNGGAPERRYVRLGVADDQFTEIVGGQLNDGERVVIRAREAQK
jgi:HlyD family secretion protein